MAAPKRTSLLLALLAAAPLIARAQTNATWSTCCAPTDPVCVQWTSMVFNPPAPAACSTLTVNGSGIVQGPVMNSTQSQGAVDAYLYGLEVYSTPISTCGETIIDILDVATGTLDAITCPVAAGQKVNLGFVLPIPCQASGLGQLNITINATDQTGNQIAFCLDGVATL